MTTHAFHIGYLPGPGALSGPVRSQVTEYLHRVAHAAASLPPTTDQTASSFWFDVGDYRCFYELNLPRRALTLTRLERRDDRGFAGASQ